MSEAALYRVVDLHMWSDEWVRNLSVDGERVWLRLLVGKETTPVPGLVVAFREGLARALRMKPKQFDDAFAELEGRAEADWQAGVIILPKAPQQPVNQPKSTAAVVMWSRFIQRDAPECELVRKLRDAWAAVLAARGPEFARAFETGSRGKYNTKKDNPSGAGINSPNNSANDTPNYSANGSPIGSASGSQDSRFKIQEEEKDPERTALGGEEGSANEARDAGADSPPAPEGDNPSPAGPTDASAKPARQPLPFRADAAAAAVQQYAGGRFFAPKRMNGGHAMTIEKVIRDYPDLAQWQEFGKWIAAGGPPDRRGALDIKWFAANCGGWFPHVKAWCKAGRGALSPSLPFNGPANGARAPARRVLGAAPVPDYTGVQSGEER